MDRTGLTQLLAVFLALVARGRCQDNSLQAEVARHAEMIQQLQAQLNAVSQRLHNQEQEVAFNARIHQRHATSVQGTNVVAFDHLDLNLGGGFHTSTGVFTAPVSGLYFFSIKIAHTPPGNIHVRLLKNGAEVAEVEASGDDRYMDRSSASVVLNLTRGDRVWAARSDGSTTLLEGELRSSFMGALIKAD